MFIFDMWSADSCSVFCKAEVNLPSEDLVSPYLADEPHVGRGCNDMKVCDENILALGVDEKRRWKKGWTASLRTSWNKMQNE